MCPVVSEVRNPALPKKDAYRRSFRPGNGQRSLGGLSRCLPRLRWPPSCCLYEPIPFVTMGKVAEATTGKVAEAFCECPWKLKLNSNLRPGGPGPRARAAPAAGPEGQAGEAPSTQWGQSRQEAASSSGVRRAGSANICRAGCRPPRARSLRRRAGRVERRCRAACRSRATSRAQSCPGTSVACS